MANQLLGLQVSLQYELINQMHSIHGEIFLVPITQYFQNKFVKKCVCHETVVVFPLSAGGWFG